jgi:hypothetical protein
LRKKAKSGPEIIRGWRGLGRDICKITARGLQKKWKNYDSTHPDITVPGKTIGPCPTPPLLQSCVARLEPSLSEPIRKRKRSSPEEMTSPRLKKEREHAKILIL